MSATNDIRSTIKTRLEAAFLAAGKRPKVYTTLLPISEAGEEELAKEAKANSDNGVVYISRGVRQYHQQVMRAYYTQDPYYILIYTNKKDDDSGINDLFDIARSSLGTFMTLQTDFVADVKGFKSGLYMAYIQCTVPSTYIAGVL